MKKTIIILIVLTALGLFIYALIRENTIDMDEIKKRITQTDMIAIKMRNDDERTLETEYETVKTLVDQDSISKITSLLQNAEYDGTTKALAPYGRVYYQLMLIDSNNSNITEITLNSDYIEMKDCCYLSMNGKLGELFNIIDELATTK